MSAWFRLNAFSRAGCAGDQHEVHDFLNAAQQPNGTDAPTVFAIMSPRRAAHLERYADRRGLTVSQFRRAWLFHPAAMTSATAPP